MSDDKIGPNHMKLVIDLATRDAFKDPKANLMTGIEWINSDEKRRESFEIARKTADQFIAAVRQASDPNPHRNSSDDDIALVILEEIEKKRSNRT